MASLLGFLNRLLPFATPGTPVYQDVIHLAAICAVLYFAPQIQERLQQNQAETGDAVVNEEPAQGQRQADPTTAQDGAADTRGPQEDAAPAEHAHNVDDEDGIPAQANDHIAEGQPGPAREPLIPQQRNVGAKKAKALARRDQRRAYHEFQRSQGEAQRARDAEGAAEREQAQAAERERRRAAEAALEAKKAKEREERRAREEGERAEEQGRRELALEIVRQRLEKDRTCDLFAVAREVGVEDEDWVEKLLRSSGIVGRRDDTITMITGMGWAARVSADDMNRVYEQILEQDDAEDDEGRIEPEMVGSLLEASLRQGPAITA